MIKILKLFLNLKPENMKKSISIFLIAIIISSCQSNKSNQKNNLGIEPGKIHTYFYSDTAYDE